MALNKKELVARFAEELDLTKAKAEEVVDFVGTLLQSELQKGEDVVLPGVGRFSLKHRPARSGRNPRTGETIKIAALNQAKFSAAKPLRDAAAAAKQKK